MSLLTNRAFINMKLVSAPKIHQVSKAKSHILLKSNVQRHCNNYIIFESKLSNARSPLWYQKTTISQHSEKNRTIKNFNYLEVLKF